jgi:hypothetical protein
MHRDNTPSPIYTACCFEEDNDHITTKKSTAGGENMMLKQYLEDERQTRLQKEMQSRSVIYKSFLLGSSYGFVVQAISYAAYCTLLKLFGKDTQPTPDSLLSSFRSVSSILPFMLPSG